MRSLVLVACLVAALAGCGGGAEPSAVTVELLERNESGQTGRATLTDAGLSGTTVILTVSPPDRFPGDVQPAQVMDATCAEILEFVGEEVLDRIEEHLTEVRDGRSRTTAGNPLSDLQGGGLSIAVFEQFPPYHLVVCGDIPRREL